MISLSSSKQMPVDYLKLGQDHCLQNRLQIAKHFAIWHHIADSVRKATRLDVTSQANTHSTAEWVRIRPEAHHQFHGAVFLGQLTLSMVHTLLTGAPAAVLKKLILSQSRFSSLITKPHFRRFRKVFEKQLLVSSCLSVCKSAWNKSAPFGRSFMNFICKNCIKIWHENWVLFNIEQMYRAHYVKT